MKIKYLILKCNKQQMRNIPLHMNHTQVQKTMIAVTQELKSYLSQIKSLYQH